MSVNISIRGLEGDGHSDAIKNYIIEHFGKVEDFVDREEWSPVDIDINVRIGAVHANNEFEINIRGPHFKVIVKKEGSDIYQLITKVIDVTLEDLRRYKEKMVDKKKSGGFHRPG